MKIIQNIRFLKFWPIIYTRGIPKPSDSQNKAQTTVLKNTYQINKEIDALLVKTGL